MADVVSKHHLGVLTELVSRVLPLQSKDKIETLAQKLYNEGFTEPKNFVDISEDSLEGMIAGRVREQVFQISDVAHVTNIRKEALKVLQYKEDPKPSRVVPVENGQNFK
eukprot:563236-Amphidinium_carterae.1